MAASNDPDLKSLNDIFKPVINISIYIKSKRVKLKKFFFYLTND